MKRLFYIFKSLRKGKNIRVTLKELDYCITHIEHVNKRYTLYALSIKIIKRTKNNKLLICII